MSTGEYRQRNGISRYAYFKSGRTKSQLRASGVVEPLSQHKKVVNEEVRRLGEIVVEDSTFPTDIQPTIEFMRSLPWVIKPAI